MEELKNPVNKSNESAAGPGGVYYQFLRHLLESCLHTLLKLFNNIWTTRDIPPSWGEALVVPIPKPGKDPSDPSNYRPIALTSCLCKTLERMVNDRMVHVLESRNLLSKVAVKTGKLETYGLTKKFYPVQNCRNVQKKDMVHNDFCPDIDVDSQSYQVTVKVEGKENRVLLTCPPADRLSLAQRYFLF
ncbi:urease subunit alpha [Plakobranchus ocellatus]|uniref:Urease subunit alpha n=1 Tax=Plakobranchus ocellatus TaxID=259542 RepID=A0AAV3ZDC5_9GAST|nr:urease subunit alpha [Plakobranchus ocellatus]